MPLKKPSGHRSIFPVLKSLPVFYKALRSFHLALSTGFLDNTISFLQIFAVSAD
jgi:hypothetical protein